MSRRWAGLLAAVAILLSACSSPARPPLERITGACPLLIAPEIKFFLGSGLLAVEHNFGGVNETLYSCSYTRDNRIVFDFNIREFPAPGSDPASVVSSIGRRSRLTTTPIVGVGEAAIYYEQPATHVAVLVAVKRSGPNLRLISFDAVTPFSSSRLAALGAIVMARI
ncbi:MAG: hypothetical protein ABW224_20435 [Kibdelosporangium sp.]